MDGSNSCCLCGLPCCNGIMHQDCYDDLQELLAESPIVIEVEAEVVAADTSVPF